MNKECKDKAKKMAKKVKPSLESYSKGEGKDQKAAAGRYFKGTNAQA